MTKLPPTNWPKASKPVHMAILMEDQLDAAPAWHHVAVCGEDGFGTRLTHTPETVSCSKCLEVLSQEV